MWGKPELGWAEGFHIWEKPDLMVEVKKRAWALDFRSCGSEKLGAGLGIREVCGDRNSMFHSDRSHELLCRWISNATQAYHHAFGVIWEQNLVSRLELRCISQEGKEIQMTTNLGRRISLICTFEEWIRLCFCHSPRLRVNLLFL